MRIEEKIWSCYDEVASTALRHGYLNIADAMFSASLEEAQRNKPDLVLLARSCFGLAATYQQRGYAREAMHYYRKAITGFEKGNDSTLNWLASSCENLALLHISDGTLGRAKSLLRRALSIYQTLFGESHPVLIPAMVHLGFIYSEYNQPDKAIYYYRLAKEIQGSQKITESC
jgi:tetratricopeptide (TPR) repeat protein